MFKLRLFALLDGFALILLVHAQYDQSGFINLDCGLPTNITDSSDPTTGLEYISDAAFIDTGVSKAIEPQYKATHQQQVAYVRSFPEGVKNCYRVDIIKGTKYLIRASFLYGNYDGLNKLPMFDLFFGANSWDSVSFVDASFSIIKEVVHVPTLDYIHVCLVNNGSGTPFISALELRPLKNTTYVTPTGSLALFLRLDVGSTTNHSYRYKEDALDRIWVPFNFDKWTHITTPLTVDTTSLTVDNVGVDNRRHNDYQVPSEAMKTASMPINASASMDFSWEGSDNITEYYVYLHFAELQNLKANQSRSFNITLNGKHWFGPLVPDYLFTITVYSPLALTEGNYSVSLVQTEDSSLPPILNAMEVYRLIDLTQPETDEDDVNAMMNIKSTYGMVKKGWAGDPCTPQNYVWDGLHCTYNGSPRIISLNLSSSGLTGEITSYISKLTMLQSLDLSNNSLTGPVPEFFSKMPNLKVLNLERNKLNGSVPAELFQRSTSGALSLRVGENSDLCAAGPCKKKKNNLSIPKMAAIGGFSILILVVAVAVLIKGLMKRGRKKQEMIKNFNQNGYLESHGERFTYSEIEKITNNFASIIGRGGFGEVYHGTLKNEIQVAVKLLHSSSKQGSKEFQNEVKLLMTAHHRNLVTLIGFCDEGLTMALVYDYVSNGNLQQHLSADETLNVFSWKQRLQIAVDAARGLEYLHNGCKPPIVHRDLKTSNILLNEKLQAKIADFGLSKVLATESATHVSTAAKGTFGYLDPEYCSTGQLNKKSDVYSFGIVLLELITGRAAIIRDVEVIPIHICQWVCPLFERKEVESIVDSRLTGTYINSSVWKAIETAMSCVPSTAIRRPDISVVYKDLKECLEIEMASDQITKTEISSEDENDDTISSNSSNTPMTSRFESQGVSTT